MDWWHTWSNIMRNDFPSCLLRSFILHKNRLHPFVHPQNKKLQLAFGMRNLKHRFTSVFRVVLLLQCPICGLLKPRSVRHKEDNCTTALYTDNVCCLHHVAGFQPATQPTVYYNAGYAPTQNTSQQNLGMPQGNVVYPQGYPAVQPQQMPPNYTQAMAMPAYEVPRSQNPTGAVPHMGQTNVNKEVSDYSEIS